MTQKCLPRLDLGMKIGRATAIKGPYVLFGNAGLFCTVNQLIQGVSSGLCENEAGLRGLEMVF